MRKSSGLSAIEFVVVLMILGVSVMWYYQDLSALSQKLTKRSGRKLSRPQSMFLRR